MYMRPLAFSLSLIVATACAPAKTVFAADIYELDAAHTHVQFSVRRFGFNDVIGSFTDVRGVITLDESAPENSSVEVMIGVASISSGNSTRDEHLASPFWFNAEEHGTMKYSSTSVEHISDTEATITGDLTLLGITKPITLTVILNKQGKDPATKKDAVGFSATANLSRHDFGMRTAENLIGNEVAIRIETLAHRRE